MNNGGSGQSLLGTVNNIGLTATISGSGFSAPPLSPQVLGSRSISPGPRAAWAATLNDQQIWTLALFLKHMDKLPTGPQAAWTQVKN